MIRLTTYIAMLGGAVASSAIQAQQADITWSSSFLATNLDSSGNPLDASFSFYLGVFNPPPPDPDWVPSPTNTAEWGQYWITADVAAYDASLNFRFASAYKLESLVEGVDLTGKKAYIWGVNRRVPGEWILLTAPGWIWPSSGGLSFPQNWTVHSSTAVLGAVQEGDVHMQTAAVSEGLPPLLRPELWRRLHFSKFELANQELTVSGWTADPNGNGRTNLVEYALGSDPRSVHPDAALESGVRNVSGGIFLSLTVSLDPHSDAILVPEITSDLATWLRGPSHVVIESQTPTTLVFRDTSPIGPGPSQRFLRLQVSLPTTP